MTQPEGTRSRKGALASGNAVAAASFLWMDFFTAFQSERSFSLLHLTFRITPLPGSVMVAQQVLVLFVEVRVLAG